MAPKSLLFLLLVALPLISAQITAPPLAKGLAWDFYKSTCADVESIVQNEVRKALRKDIGLAAGLLRIHFHDCFVQGCDGSVLLDGSASGPSEKQAPPNLTLRKAGFDLINKVRHVVHKRCGRVVSCSDITALAARDAVHLAGGPNYPVPLGRRDGLNFATQEATLDFLPAPTSNTSVLIKALERLRLDVNDLVALSGGHTIGIGHCTSFEERLYPRQDPIMDKTFANNLKRTCPTLGLAAVSTPIDLRSPDLFDNKYYVDLMNRQGLFTSDQDLYTDKRTRPIVESFAIDQNLFFEKYAYSVVKMGMLSVLTGDQGEIRANCSARNTRGTVDILPLVEDVLEGAASAF